jgi:hypothetical protein
MNEPAVILLCVAAGIVFGVFVAYIVLEEMDDKQKDDDEKGDW